MDERERDLMRNRWPSCSRLTGSFRVELTADESCRRLPGLTRIVNPRKSKREPSFLGAPLKQKADWGQAVYVLVRALFQPCAPPQLIFHFRVLPPGNRNGSY